MPGKKENLRTNKQKNNISLPDSQRAGSKRRTQRQTQQKGSFTGMEGYFIFFSRDWITGAGKRQESPYFVWQSCGALRGKGSVQVSVEVSKQRRIQEGNSFDRCLLEQRARQVSDLGNPESKWAGEWYRSRGCCKNGQRDSDQRSYWNVGKYVLRRGDCSTGRRNINIWKTNLNSYMEADLPLGVADDLAKSGNQSWP